MPRFTTGLSVVGAVAITLLLAPTADAAPKRIRVNTANDTVDVNPGDGICADADGKCSLRAAIMEANAGSDDVVITLGRVPYPLTIEGRFEDAAATGDLDITGNVTIKGRRTKIDGMTLHRLFDVHEGGSLTLIGVELTGGAVTGESGGAVRSAGTLIAKSTKFTNNSAAGDGGSGGAIFNDGGVIDLKACQFSAGSARRAGGGIHVTSDGFAEVMGGSFSRNSAANEGGGLWNSSNGGIVVTGARIKRNSAPDGPDVFNQGGTFTIDGIAVEAVELP